MELLERAGNVLVARCQVASELATAGGKTGSNVGVADEKVEMTPPTAPLVI